jgi:hypothetical protein
MTQRRVTSYLMIAVPTDAGKGADQPVPRDVPGEFRHAGTLTVASVRSDSFGTASPCFSALST